MVSNPGGYSASSTLSNQGMQVATLKQALFNYAKDKSGTVYDNATWFFYQVANGLKGRQALTYLLMALSSDRKHVRPQPEDSVPRESQVNLAENYREELEQQPHRITVPHATSLIQDNGNFRQQVSGIGDKATGRSYRQGYNPYSKAVYLAKSKLNEAYHAMVEAFKKLRLGTYQKEEKGVNHEMEYDPHSGEESRSNIGDLAEHRGKKRQEQPRTATTTDGLADIVEELAA